MNDSPRLRSMSKEKFGVSVGPLHFGSPKRRKFRD
jgi:hypothetical protein